MLALKDYHINFLKKTLFQSDYMGKVHKMRNAECMRNAKSLWLEGYKNFKIIHLVSNLLQPILADFLRKFFALV
jgi:hypothetical protein